MLLTAASSSTKKMPTKTTKIAAPSPMPNATSANGIQATGAIGASSVITGYVSLWNTRSENARLPRSTAAMNASASPLTMRRKLAQIAVSDEVPADPLDADLRQEELRLVLDLADEDPRRRKDHGVDEIERRRELPEADHGADRQHPPSGADGQRSHQTYVLEWTLTRLQSSGLSLMTASRYLKF